MSIILNKTKQNITIYKRLSIELMRINLFINIANIYLELNFII